MAAMSKEMAAKMIAARGKKGKKVADTDKDGN